MAALFCAMAMQTSAATAGLTSGGTLRALSRHEVPGRAQRTLTLGERVSYQRAIEEVYWRHRIWPRNRGERPDPKPSLDAVMSQAQIEKKVSDYLGKSQALANYWQRPITTEQLQAEMDRMAQNTRQPDVLRELFEALGNDPFVIAECLARPLLAECLLVQPEFERVKQQSRTFDQTVAAGANYTLPTISGPSGGCFNDTWSPTNLTGAPDARYNHTAVWTGSEMIVWGGNFFSLNTGARYYPSTDNWTATNTVNAPDARSLHTAVWTGSEMIVWGGESFDGVQHYWNTGGRYSPNTDSWIATSTTNAPDGRYSHVAAWTGAEMIVWGGWDNNTVFNTGGRYNPSTDSWTAIPTASAPAARYSATAVWTGSEMIVWAGTNTVIVFNTGGRYNPSTDNWTATNAVNAPDARSLHTAVWTGSEMIVWGGWDGVHALNTGSSYSPNTNSWTATSTTNAPDARISHTAVWSGSEMIIWGGSGNAVAFLDTGGRYNPDTNNWTATSTSGAPSARVVHTALWTDTEMIVWGGSDISALNTGGQYCAQSGPTPTPTPCTGRCAPTPRPRPTPHPRPAPP
jgi:N-acetylneuraminic acid mutarotase